MLFGISLTTILLTLIPAYFVAKWTANGQFKQLQKTQVYSEKRELYKKIIDLLHSANEIEEKILLVEMKKINAAIMLTASKEVLVVYGDMMQLLYTKDFEDPIVNKQYLVLFGELAIAMRKDFGHEGFFTAVAWYVPLRPTYRDLTEIFPEVKVQQSYSSALNKLAKIKSNKP